LVITHSSVKEWMHLRVKGERRVIRQRKSLSEMGPFLRSMSELLRPYLRKDQQKARILVPPKN